MPFSHPYFIEHRYSTLALAVSAKLEPPTNLPDPRQFYWAFLKSTEINGRKGIYIIPYMQNKKFIVDINMRWLRNLGPRGESKGRTHKKKSWRTSEVF